ncbi:MAG: magnesium transporter [Gammaproteobacteria bacterium]|jgi:magnesium transporter
MPDKNKPTDSDVLEALQEALESGADEPLETLLERLHPAGVADALEAMPRELRPELWRRIAAPTKGEVLLELHGEVRRGLIEASGKEELLAALSPLEMDELADLDADLPLPVVDAMVRAMDAQRRARYETVRSFPDDTAGGLMDVDAAAVHVDMTLAAVLRYLQQMRQREGALPEHLDSLVVVDRLNHYLGVLPLSELVSRDAGTPVREAMDRSAPAIAVLTPADKVARLFEDQDLMSAAVVDEDGALLGRITIDDVVDVMREGAEHDVMSRAGLTEATDMFAPLLPSMRRRAVWLGVNLFNALVAAWVIGLFEGSIDRVVALAVLMPVVASMGGVAGNQTLTLVTRGIALEHIRPGNAPRLLLRELALGLLNGLFWALVVSSVAVMWYHNLGLGVVFGAALVINLLTGALAGTLVPMLLQRLGIDPALAGGVVLTAATDVVGFSAFLGLATLVLL